MQEDISRVYNAKLIEIKENLKKLEKLEFKIDKYKDLVKKIDEETKQEIENCYNLFSKETSNLFLHDSVESTYSKALDKLQELNDLIVDEYDTYAIIYAEYNLLNDRIKKVSTENITSIVLEAKNLLDKMQSSSSIDYDIERKLDENIYDLIYKIIKLELIYSNSQITLLDYVKTNETDATNISILIKNEIDSLVPKIVSDYEEINEKVKSLEVQGLGNANLLDKELVKLIAFSTNEELIENTKEKFIIDTTSYDKLVKKMSSLKEKTNKLAEELVELKTNKKSNSRKRCKKEFLMFINSLIIVGGIATGIMATKESSKLNYYKTTTTTIDTSTDEKEVEEEYTGKQSNSISITEYSPWEDPGYFREEYTRNIYEYDTNSLKVEYDDIYSYLTSDIKSSLSYSTKTEESEKPTDNNYKENKYVITRKVQNQDEYIKRICYPLWIFESLMTSFGVIGVDLFVFKLISKEKLSNIKYEKNKIIDTIEQKNKLYLENKKQISNLEEELEKERQRVCLDYEKLPDSIKRQKDINDKTYILTIKRG